MIRSNRIALKNIACLTIDSQFVQKYGNAAYLYEGEETEDYKALCRELYAATNDNIGYLLSLEKDLAAKGYDTHTPQKG
jgi:hypothetical protein